MQLSQEQLKEIEDYVNTLPEGERKAKIEEIEKQLQETPQCPFCLMVENKIQTVRVYEDSYFIAVLEINPANPGHIILFTKRHTKNLPLLNEEEIEEISKILKKLQSALLSLYKSSNILISDGLDSGNKFEHFVVNLIPRKKDDKVSISWQPDKIEEKKLKEIQQKIIKSIPKEKPKKLEPIKDLEIKRKYRA